MAMVSPASIASASRLAALSISRKLDGSGRKSRIVGDAVPGKVCFIHSAGEQQLVDKVAAKVIAAVPPPAPWLAEQAAFHVAGKLAHDSNCARSALACTLLSAGT